MSKDFFIKVGGVLGSDFRSSDFLHRSIKILEFKFNGENALRVWIVAGIACYVGEGYR